VKESCKSTELKRGIRTEMRWKSNEVSLSSPDDARILLPRLDKKLDVDAIVIVVVIIVL